MKTAKAGALGEVTEREFAVRLRGVSFDVAADVADAIGVGVASDGGEGMAAQTWAQAVAFGLGGIPIEAHVLTERVACGNGRPAVDAGGEDADEIVRPRLDRAV